MKAVHGRVTISAVLVLTMLLSAVPTSSTAPITNEHFNRTWQRTDKPVSDLVVSRTWMWGNEPFTAASNEPYVEAPGGKRQVQYFDKSRMEISHDPSVTPDSPWYITNGLLVKELMTGQMQVGDNTFESHEPARVNVAGDPDDDSGVSYWFMGLFQDSAALSEGAVIDWILTPYAPSSRYVHSDDLAGYGITAAHYVPDTQHTVATPFWDFMNAWGTVYEDGSYQQAPLFENPFYATGFPLTEAYWASVKVAGTHQPVLIQCFERRCLTYTPNNDPAWRVEAGNVGQHYFKWRYGSGDAPPDNPAPVYDHIPGLDVVTALLHLQAIGRCEEPTEKLLYVIMKCTPWSYLEADYNIIISTASTSKILSINVNVSDRTANPSPRISEIAAFVLGWVAQIPFTGAYPIESTTIVREHIDESGYFDVPGVRFGINPPEYMEPDWADTPFWGYTRFLHIAPTELTP